MSIGAALADETEAVEDAVWKRRCDVRYQAAVQLRYHKRRQMFFDRVDKVSKTLTLLLGATLIGAEIKESLPYVAASISFLSLLALVFSYSERKQVHKEFAESCGSLMASIDAVPPPDLDSKQASAWASDYAKIITKVPPPLKRLTIYCEREQTISQGDPIQKSQQCWRNFWWLGMYYF